MTARHRSRYSRERGRNRNRSPPQVDLAEALDAVAEESMAGLLRHALRSNCGAGGNREGLGTSSRPRPAAAQ